MMSSLLSFAVPGIIALVSLCPPAMASSLEQQLDIQPYNATAGSSRDVADEWMQLGQRQLDEGAYDQAIASWQQAATLYWTLGDTQGQGLAYSALGSTYALLGQYPEAERAIRLRIAAARDHNDVIGASYGLNNLGTLYVNQGQLEPAREFFVEALQLAQTANDRRTRGLSLSNLGLIATLTGDLDTAIELLEAATNSRYLAADYLGEAHSSNSLGDVYLALGRNHNAIGAYRVALRTAVEAGDRALQLRALDGLLTIYFDQEDWSAVESYLARRSHLTLGSEEPDLQTAVTLRWMGDYYSAQGEMVTAETAYSKGLGLARALANTPLEAELTNRMLGL
jgi:tetratricopeptide (TPR) repeat protein